MPKQWDDGVLRMAAELSKYQQVYPEGEQVPVPQYVIIGKQSFGKTRLLSCIAGYKLGGAEISGTGTRCPAFYKFKTHEVTSFWVGTDWGSMTEVARRAVSEFLTQHMAEIAKDDDESKAKPGFSNDPVLACVFGPNSPSLSVVDLPGIKKSSTDAYITACNSRIKEMYKHYFSDCNTVPIVLFQFDVQASCDAGETATEVSNFIRESGMPRSVRSKAIVFVTKLDAVQHGLKPEHVKSLLESLSKEGFRKERVVMGTLRPDILGDKSSRWKDEDAMTDEYFGEERQKLEEKYLQPWLEERQLDKVECKYGFDALMNLIQEDVHSEMRKNGGQIQRWLFGKLREELQRGEAICRRAQELDKTALRAKILMYVDLYSDALAGVATRDAGGRFRDVLIAAGKGLVAKDGEAKIIERLEKATARTFEEEAESMERSCEVPVDGAWLLCEEVKEAIDSSPPSSMEDLRSETKDGELLRLGGGAAVRRLLKRLGVAILTKKLRTFTHRELLDKQGSPMGLNNVVGLDWSRLVRIMVQDLTPIHDQIKIICLWCKDIYVSQADGVCEILREDVHLLDEFPRLRDLLDGCIKQQYSDAVTARTDAAVERIAASTHSSFMNLNMDNIVHLQTIVMVTIGKLFQSGCMLPRPHKVDEKTETSFLSPLSSLLSSVVGEKATEEIQRELPPGLLAPDCLMAFQKLLQQMFHPTLVGSRSSKQQEEADTRHTDMLLSLVEETGFTVGMDNTAEGTPSSVECWVRLLNEVAQTVARLNLGLEWMGAKAVLMELVETQITQLPKGIPRALEHIPMLLLEDKQEGFLRQLTNPTDAPTLREMADLAGKMQKLRGDIQNLVDQVQVGSPLSAAQRSELDAARTVSQELLDLKSRMEAPPNAAGKAANAAQNGASDENWCSRRAGRWRSGHFDRPLSE
mmetsp:Transcript_40370/g.92828  ORF Transcript_40370/g.92828 Transcript_40370/m.92828 type:complete len:921 (+) Transcript_40370:53-2815(+)